MQEQTFSNHAAPSPYAMNLNGTGTPATEPEPLPRNATGSSTQQGLGESYFNPWGEPVYTCSLYGGSYLNFAGFISHYCQCFDQDASPCGSYNPQQGRWMNPGGNPNPLDPQSFNQYAYNENNPIDAASSPDALGPGGDENKPSVTFTDPSTTGPQQDVINATLNRLLANLPNDAQCLNFLMEKGGKPLDMLRDLEQDNLVGHANLFQNGDPLAIAAISGGEVPGQVTTVNNRGAFFKQTIGNVSLNVGGYAGGTPAAQAFTLLHELGHLENVLENDLGDPGAERRNNNAVKKNCKKTVKACSKR